MWELTDGPKQDNIFAQYGVRWSELCRLPYWDPVQFTVIDSMHNHYLGLLQHHCRSLWGMDAQMEDGDGEYPPERKVYRRPNDDYMKLGWYFVKARNEEGLLTCTDAVLWHLCLELDLRRGFTVKKSHVRELITWVS